jgi:nucleoside-diphosphate-sugar epimerase
MEVLIVGCGEVGTRLAALHRARGDRVTGVVRSAASATALRSAGSHALELELDTLTDALPAAEWLYWLAPPPADGDSDPRLGRGLAALPVPARALYMSTTAVYGERRGEWTDETTPVAPVSARGRRRLDAERQWRFWARQNDVFHVVIRAAAIWCAARLPLARLQAGTSALAPAESALINRIHAQDLAAVCLAALERGTDGATYDAADGAPSSTAEYLQAVAAAFDLPPPNLLTRAQAAAGLEADAFIRDDESKRIRATRIRTELGVTPRSVAEWLAIESKV